MASIRARECAEWLFTVGMILLGRTNFTNLDSSLKLLCSLYGTPSMEMKIESKQLNNWKLDLIGTHLWTYHENCVLHFMSGFIRSRLPVVNLRLRCLSPPVTKPHIQESSSCNIKYRNRQKQLWVFVLHTLIHSCTAAYLSPMAIY